MLKESLKRFLTHPLARGLDLDAPENTLQRAQLIQDKSFLKQFYQDGYRSIAALLPPQVKGPVVELGSGGGFLKGIIPDLITSEVLKIPIVDLIFNGQSMPFKRTSLRAIVMMDVFHHIPRPGRFLAQAADAAKPGGRIIMIEPWVTAWSRFVYRYVHHEPFDVEVKDWKINAGGPLSGANSAIPWIVFDRDRKKFEWRFPQWRIRQIKLHTPFCYLLSGGVTYKNFLPGACYKFCRQFEFRLQPLNPHIAMFATIVLQRQPDNSS